MICTPFYTFLNPVYVAARSAAIMLPLARYADIKNVYQCIPIMSTLF